MEQKRKIVVPLGPEPETPHFDAEETLLSARPVVPLNQSETRAVTSHTQSTAPVAFYRRLPFLALVVVVAVGVGALGGLGFARYRYQQRAATPSATEPSATQNAPTADTRTATVQTPNRAEQEAQAVVPSVPEVNIEDKATDEQSAAVDGDKADKAPAPRAKASDDADKEADDKKAEDRKRDDDDIRVAPTTPRERRRVEDDGDESDYPTRAQRRERRRRSDDEAIDVPRRIERAGEQINRIREIFEGRQQRP